MFRVSGCGEVRAGAAGGFVGGPGRPVLEGIDGREFERLPGLAKLKTEGSY